MINKRRRQTSLASTAILAAALLSMAAGEDLAAAELHHTVNDEDLIYPHPPSFRRQLEQSAAETFAAFTSDTMIKAMPIDLKIDISTKKAYLATSNGWLEPYCASTFASSTANLHGSEKGGSSHGGIGIDLDEQIMKDANDGHSQSAHLNPPPSERLYYKILEEDGIAVNNGNGGVMHGKSNLRGKKDNDRRLLEAVTNTVHLDSMKFSMGQPVAELLDADSSMQDEELMEVFLSREEDEVPTSTLEGRSLQGSPQDSDADIFANTPQDNHNMKSLGRKNGGRYSNGNGRGNNNNNNKNKNNNKQKRKFPQIDRINPSANTAIRSKQTFSARVQPSVQTNSPVSKVQFRLTDHTGSTSDWISMPKVSEDLYELTVEGFRKHPGTEWQFVVLAVDGKGKKKSTEDISFNIEGNSSGNSGNGGNDRPNAAPPAPSPTTTANNHKPMPKTKQADSSWKHGGAIQSTTGRILFQFDNSDQTLVCSGSVIKDGHRGTYDDWNNGRSIIQTAAHCAYSDVMKKFASKAIFIPDQVSTRGVRSDFDCGNDKYGCWSLSFAVVAEGWTKSSFPVNVEWDYAYYVVFDDKSTHSRGYKSGLTGQLDRDVDAVAVDFDSDPLIDKEFIFSIGYSADKDPELRHCAMYNSKINGVDYYDNLWLDDCAMRGGASGGGWIRDMDNSGVGTLVGINSWGFTHKAGMASPNLSTASGSWAECLFEGGGRRS